MTTEGIDTQDPPGDESKVAHYLEGVLKNEGIESEILEPVPGRASIVARLKGNGKKRPAVFKAGEILKVNSLCSCPQVCPFEITVAVLRRARLPKIQFCQRL